MNQHDKVIFNGQKISLQEFEFTNAFRALMFGDGLFESILIDKKHVFLLELHISRLNRGMSALKLAINEHISIKSIIEGVQNLMIELPDHQNAYRLRIVVWRSGLGKYTPEENYTTNSLLSLEMSTPFHFGAIKKIGYSETVKIYSNPLSNFKTLNGLPYVLASMEKEENNLDELFLLNSQNEVAEGTSSNVFFVKNGILMTPKLSSGCLDGVMRNYLISAIKAANIKIMLTDISPDEANRAEITFFCNSFSLRYKMSGNSSSGWLNRAEGFIDSMPKLPLLL